MSDMREQLRRLPGVDRLLDSPPGKGWLAAHPRWAVTKAVRLALEEARRDLLAGSLAEAPDADALNLRVEEYIRRLVGPRLAPVINATGVVLHTNLGRAPLAPEALEALCRAAAGYSNLEYDLETRRRGSRHDHLRELLVELSGAEDALVVNNNAGAVLLALDTLAAGREAVVSRGELVEIGESFRIPDIMAKGGVALREVGATNRTRIADYRAALGEHTALLLKVHTSNYRITGFHEETSIEELVSLGRERGIPVLFDVGSGALVRWPEQGGGEPTIAEVVDAGADIVTFSGDKMLGGPQAGLIVGRREYVRRLARNPLARALRIDKLSLAAMEATLRCYLEGPGGLERIPFWRLLRRDIDEIEGEARALAEELEAALGDRAQVGRHTEESAVGGGALPLLSVPTAVVSLKPASFSVAELNRRLHKARPPVVGRVADDALLLDLRTVLDRRALKEAVLSAWE